MFRWQPKALQVASGRTTMADVVPNQKILVSKFRISSFCMCVCVCGGGVNSLLNKKNYYLK